MLKGRYVACNKPTDVGAMPIARYSYVGEVFVAACSGDNDRIFEELSRNILKSLLSLLGAAITVH